MWIFGGETTSWLASPVEKPSSLRKLWRIAFHSAQDPFDVGGGVVYVGQILNRLPNLPNVTRGNDWTPWKTLLPKDQALTSAAMTGRVGWRRSWRSLGKLSFFFVKWNSPKKRTPFPETSKQPPPETFFQTDSVNVYCDIAILNKQWGMGVSYLRLLFI